MKALELFPVTIFKTKIQDNNYLKDLLVEDILESSQYLDIPKEWLTNNVKTSFNGEPKGKEVLDKHIDTLYSRYQDCFYEIFDKEFEVEIINFWYNVYRDGEYQEIHDHVGHYLMKAHFSCIHYLSFDKEVHEGAEFRDPLHQIRNLSLEFDSNRCGEVVTPDIEEGDFLMFPSYLQHCVLPCKKSNYPRISLSFNVHVKRYGNDRSY